MVDCQCRPGAAGRCPRRHIGRSISYPAAADLSSLTATPTQHDFLERANSHHGRLEPSRAPTSPSSATVRTTGTRQPFLPDKPDQDLRLYRRRRRRPNTTTMGLPVTIRNNAVAALAEFVGTYLFLLFGFAGAQIANAAPFRADDADSPNLLALIYISFIFGFSLLVNVFVFYRISGGQFNPAVSSSAGKPSDLQLPLVFCFRPPRLSYRLCLLFWW